MKNTMSMLPAFRGFSEMHTTDILNLNSDVEPTIEELSEIASTEKPRLDRNIGDKDYHLYLWRRKAYAGKPRNVLYPKDGKVTCPCGQTHNVQHLFHREDADSQSSDVMYSLLRLYDFAGLCDCGSYIYGYQQKQTVPVWLQDALKSLSEEPVTDVQEPVEPTMWVQLSFDDIYDVSEITETTAETVHPTSSETVEMTPSEDGDIQRLQNELSAVNVELAHFCESEMGKYGDEPFALQLARVKTPDITMLAKKYKMLNFARMNNLEKKVGVLLLQLMISNIPVSADATATDYLPVLAREVGLDAARIHVSEQVCEKILPYKTEYNQLQDLIKKKMLLSKACVWGKAK